jgi:hypothetical protein
MMVPIDPQDRATPDQESVFPISQWMWTCSAGLVVVCVLLAAAIEIRAARRERASYERLCEMGATGDDWVSFREFITGSPPIVQLEIPSTVPREVAFELLPDFYNLEYLGLQYESLSDEQLEVISRLRLDALRLGGPFTSIDDVERLARLRGLRFLYLPNAELSPAAAGRLQSLLPLCRISVD